MDDFWGARRTGRVRMVGAFPESDDEEEEEEEVGPLDRPRSRSRSKSRTEAVSPGRNRGKLITEGKEPAVEGKRDEEEPGNDADPEWGVD